MQRDSRDSRFSIRLAALAVAGVLASCGGGDDTPAPKSGEFVLSFGTNGIAALEGGPFENSRASARFVVTDPASGAIRTAGFAWIGALFAHFLPNGQPDAEFAGTGYLWRPSPPPASSIAIPEREGVAALTRPDGNEYLVESMREPRLAPCEPSPNCAFEDGMGYSTVVRLVNRAGNPFPAFGPVRPGADVSIPNIDPLQALVEPSGGLLVLGRAISGFDQPRVNRLTRLSPGGTPDASFELRATEAIWCNDIPGLRTRTGAVMAHRADGKLLVAQSFRVSATLGTSRTCISRLLPDGTLDPTFGSGGQVVLGWEFLWDEMSPVAIFALPSGGSALFLQMRRQLDGNFHYYYMIATMTADGALDASRFDRGISGPTDLHVAKLTAVARQADGRFLIAGYPALGDNLPAPPGGPVERFDRSQPRIGRIHPEGGADLSFGPLGTGYASLLSFGKRLEPRHLHIGPDRGILVAGAAGAAGPVNDNEITRFAVGKLVGEQ